MPISVLLGDGSRQSDIGPFAANSVSFGIQHAASFQDPVPTKSQVSDVALSKVRDNFSILLMQASTQGTVFDPSTITFLRDDGSTSSVFTLKQVVVTSFRTGGGDDSSESVNLNFTSATSSAP
jgi:type VI protein secretion system component Hcp